MGLLDDPNLQRALEAKLQMLREVRTIPVVEVDTPPTEFGMFCQNSANIDWMKWTPAEPMFLDLNEDAEDLFSHIRGSKTIFLIKAVQSGKTSEVFKIIEHTWKYSCTVFLSAKNAALAEQTNKRGRISGWQVYDFRNFASSSEAKRMLEAGCGKKIIYHFLMESNSMDYLRLLCACVKCPITFIVDEGDMNRNVNGDDDGAEEVSMPPITKAIQICKNLLADRDDNSKTIFVTATPQGLFTAEKDVNRKVIVKAPFKNYCGVAYNHPVDRQSLREVIRHCSCKARDRWTGNNEDRYNNTFRHGLSIAIDYFQEVGTKDESVKQLMLVSLENRNISQARMATFISASISKDYQDEIEVLVWNGENKDKQFLLLSDKIQNIKKRKIIIVAGFMASRGVSFTDFSDSDNKFELIAQVHNTKKTDPLNSSQQAMRWMGQARKTVIRPMYFCNQIGYQDCVTNFIEGYRICKELAEGRKIIYTGRYDKSRSFTQKYCYRYMEIYPGSDSILLRESRDLSKHLPITEL